MTVPTLELQNLHKRLGAQPVLNGVDLTVQQGSVHFVLGVSGAGKSVLIKHIVGLLRADAGAILFEGRDITHLSESDFAQVRQRCQLIFQNSTLFEQLTVRDNVAMPLRRRFGLSRAMAAAQADAALDKLHLSPLAERLAGELGMGIQKRVAIARALALRPAVLLYDEPTTGQDPVAARRTDRLMGELAEHWQVTQLVVSHDMISARAVAQRISFLHAGRIYFDGQPDDFWEQLDDPILQPFTAPQPLLADSVL